MNILITILRRALLATNWLFFGLVSVFTITLQDGVQIALIAVAVATIFHFLIGWIFNTSMDT